MLRYFSSISISLLLSIHCQKPLWAISPVAFVTENLIDIAILVVMSVVVWIFAWSKKKLVNWHGAVMLVSYVAYLVYICIR